VYQALKRQEEPLAESISEFKPDVAKRGSTPRRRPELRSRSV